MRKLLRNICILMFSIALTLEVACNKKHKQSIFSNECKLEVGDVVFRKGSGFTSQAVLFADNNGCYSHVGIVVDSMNKKMIIHSVPNEPEFEGDVDRVKIDSPNTFFSTEHAEIGEIMRPKNKEIAKKAAQQALILLRNKTLFDHDYDSEDTTKMYCTELIENVFRNAGECIVGKPTYEFNIMGIKTKCWLPSDIHKSSFLQSIKILK